MKPILLAAMIVLLAAPVGAEEVQKKITLWAWIEANPTLTVGILGFLGVMGTLWFNAWLARRQRREELRHERQTLRAALIEELKIIQKGNTKNIEKYSDPPKPTDITVPTDIMDDVYRAFTRHIGLLSPGEVQKVMLAYLSIRHVNSLFLVMGSPLENTDRQVRIRADKIPTLLAMLRGLIDPIGEAIQAMENAQDAD